MAFTLTPANVQGGVVTEIALAPLAATFATGVEEGMKGDGTYTADPVLVGMSMGNDFTDAHNIVIEYPAIQNRIADVGAAIVYAQAGCQAIVKTSSGDVGAFTGQTWDAETILGMEFDWDLAENVIKKKLMTQVSEATLKTLWSNSVGTHVWSAGEDATKRRHKGIQNVTIGGANTGILRSFSGNVKSVSGMTVQGRPIMQGIEVNLKVVMAQTAQADHDAALDAANADDTVIVNWFNGDALKLTNLFAGKAAKLTFGKEHSIELTIKAYYPKGSTRIDYTNDTDVLELIMLNNTAQV